MVRGEALSVLGADRRMIRLSARVLGAEAFRPVRAKCHLHGCSADIGRPAYLHAIFAECDDSAVVKKLCSNIRAFDKGANRPGTESGSKIFDRRDTMTALTLVPSKNSRIESVP